MSDIINILDNIYHILNISQQQLLQQTPQCIATNNTIQLVNDYLNNNISYIDDLLCYLINHSNKNITIIQNDNKYPLTKILFDVRANRDKKYSTIAMKYYNTPDFFNFKKIKGEL